MSAYAIDGLVGWNWTCRIPPPSGPTRVSWFVPALAGEVEDSAIAEMARARVDVTIPRAAVRRFRCSIPKLPDLFGARVLKVDLCRMRALPWTQSYPPPGLPTRRGRLDGGVATLHRKYQSIESY